MMRRLIRWRRAKRLIWSGDRAVALAALDSMDTDTIATLGISGDYPAAHFKLDIAQELARREAWPTLETLAKAAPKRHRASYCAKLPGGHQPGDNCRCRCGETFHSWGDKRNVDLETTEQVCTFCLARLLRGRIVEQCGICSGSDLSSGIDYYDMHCYCKVTVGESVTPGPGRQMVAAARKTL